MARAPREIGHLIKAMGGNELSAYGLCHLGDYEATLFSPHSHNRMYGESVIKKTSYDKYTFLYIYNRRFCFNIQDKLLFRFGQNVATFIIS